MPAILIFAGRACLLDITIPDGAPPGRRLTVELYNASGELVSVLMNALPGSSMVRIPIPGEVAVHGVAFARIVHGRFAAAVRLIL